MKLRKITTMLAVAAMTATMFTGCGNNESSNGVTKDTKITVISREEGSGTRDAFQEIVGYDSSELISDATITDASGNLLTTVAQNKNAIGFVSFSYIDDTVSAVKLDGVEATEENAKSGSYKLSRPFLIVTKEDKLSDEGQKVIDYILSDKGQKIVKEDKLITLK